MKNLNLKTRIRSFAGPLTALLVAGAVLPLTAAPFDSPVGDWDFGFSGAQRGVAQITFLGDNTLTGFQILSPGKPIGYTPALDPRTGLPKNGSSGAGGSAWGGVLIDGYWGFNGKGKIVGAATLTSSTSTNGLNFLGTVTAGTRMIFRASDGNGGMVYRGLPRAALPDISGVYTASGKQGRSLFTGFFTLSPSSSPNLYDVVAHGPGFDGSGFAVVTSNKKLGIYYQVGATNPAIVALSGPFNATQLKGNIKGVDGTNNYSLKVIQPLLD